VAEEFFDILDDSNHSYDNTTSGLVASDVKGAIDELATSGGGGASGTHEFTASGDLAEGITVALNSDGTVSVIQEGDAASIGVTVPFVSPHITSVATVYDPVNSKVVVAYQSSDDSQGSIKVGTVSGDSISFGATAKFGTVVASIGICYDDSASKVVIVYNESGDSGVAVVGTTGDTILLGNPTTYVTESANYNKVVYDSVNNNIVVFYSTASEGTSRVGVVSGTDISFPNVAVPFLATLGNYVAACFNETSGKCVVIFGDAFGASGKAIIGTVSANTISYGTPAVMTNSTMQASAVATIAGTSRIVAAIQNRDIPTGQGTSMIGTIDGTDISFADSYVFCAGDYVTDIDVMYDATNNTVVVTYRDTANAEYGTVRYGFINGDIISFGDAITFESNITYQTSLAYDSQLNKFVITYRIASVSGNSIIFNNVGASNVPETIGLNTEAVLDTETATITILTGVNGHQSGLTIDALYYVDGTGSLTTTPTGNVYVGRAISTTEILVEVNE